LISKSALIKWEIPRLCRGGSRSLTFTKVSIAETTNREPPSKRKEKLDGQDREPKSHEMGVQVPRCVYTQGQKEAAVHGVAQTPG
jgi:hypothetical protein